jgi:CRISPR-associated protein Cas1
MGSSLSQILGSISALQAADSVDTLMGIEGAAAKSYFNVFDMMILRNKDDFRFQGRSRRPPLDPVNAMLSFCYTLLGLDIASALETVGLDSAIGFLHQLRPGRKSLALDLLEELRAPLADRFVLSQINLGIVTQKQFLVKENGAVLFDDDGRRTFLSEWQKRKQKTITHPFLKEKISWGLVPYVQAMLLSRYMRGDLDEYPPFLWK